MKMHNIIVIPVYKQVISKWEEMSLRQCCKVLSAHVISLVTFAELDCSVFYKIAEEYKVKLLRENFDSSYFAGLAGYNRLLISRNFYQRFSRYDYMLIYQLDAYVFRDELDAWCAKGYDYIGAPWFEKYKSYEEGAALWRVGNGGFSLRRIKTFINILNDNNPILGCKALYDRYNERPTFVKLWDILKSLTGWHNNIIYYVQEYEGQEDLFWTQYLPSLGIELRMPHPIQAISFSMEKSPAYLYELNGNKLPFGCHAWQKYEYNTFWKQYISLL